jgi:hypothetical protein
VFGAGRLHELGDVLERRVGLLAVDADNGRLVPGVDRVEQRPDRRQVADVQPRHLIGDVAVVSRAPALDVGQRVLQRGARLAVRAAGLLVGLEPVVLLAQLRARRRVLGPGEGVGDQRRRGHRVRRSPGLGRAATLTAVRASSTSTRPRTAARRLL